MINSRIIPSLQKTKTIGDSPWEAGRAAVALIFRPDDHLCMIRRAKKESDYWSGHMAFPGGREERGDKRLRDTAERETQEEIGVSLRPEHFIGRLTDLRHPKLAVSAFVYFVEEELSFRIDPAEVASTYWLPFQAFLDPQFRTTKKTSYNDRPLEMPLVNIGDADVWGISLFFIDDLINCCELSPEA